MLIPLNLNEVQEPKPVPIGRYDLVITNCEETLTKEKQKPQFRVSIGIEGHDEAPNITHFVGIPSEEDEPNALRFKSLLLKRFLTLFKIPISPEINTEQLAMEMVGSRCSAEVNLEVEIDPLTQKPKPDGAVYNRLVVPRLRGEGTATAKQAAAGGQKR